MGASTIHRTAELNRRVQQTQYALLLWICKAGFSKVYSHAVCCFSTTIYHEPEQLLCEHPVISFVLAFLTRSLLPIGVAPMCTRSTGDVDIFKLIEDQNKFGTSPTFEYTGHLENPRPTERHSIIALR